MAEGKAQGEREREIEKKNKKIKEEERKQVANVNASLRHGFYSRGFFFFRAHWTNTNKNKSVEINWCEIIEFKFAIAELLGSSQVLTA